MNSIDIALKSGVKGVLVLLFYCLLLLPLFAGVLCLVLVLLSVSFCNHLGGKERAGCFALTVFLVSCNCLPRGAVGWSAVCDCGIS